MRAWVVRGVCFGQEALSALIDGESVDPSELERALQHPNALHVLRDFAALRAELARTTPAAPPSLVLPVAGRGRLRRVALVAAAALAAAVLVGVGMRSGSRSVDGERPPEAQREVRFTEGVDWFRQ